MGKTRNGIGFGYRIGVASKGSKLNPYCDEYNAVLSAMSIEPSLADKAIQNAMLKKLVDRGYFAKAEFIDIFCTHNGGQNINWKNPGTYNPSPVNSPTFTEYVGYTGNSANVRYVRLNFIPSTNAALINKSNFCMIYGVANDVQENLWDVGVYDGATSLSILSRDTDGKYTMLANNDGSTGVTTSSSKGHYSMSRTADSEYAIMKDIYNSKKPGNNASENLVTKELYACGRNQNGTPAPCNRTISYVMLFSYLKPWEAEEVMAIMEQYIRNYGTGLNALKLVVPQIDTLTNLELDTYVEPNGSTVHPSVIAKALGGYNYWMANTPYTDNNNIVENPSIWASVDGNTWVVPAGLTNPIVAKPKVGFNCDTDIIYDGSKFYVFFNENGIFKIISSSDGLTWGNKKTVTVDGSWAGVSPSLIKIGSYYYLYYIEFSSPNGVLKRQRSTSIDGLYSNAETISLSTSGYWHFDIKKIGNTYWMPMKNESVDGLEMYYSANAIDFVKCSRPLVRYSSLESSGVFYRPTIEEIGNRIVCYVPMIIAGEYFTHRMDLTVLD